MYCLNCGNRLNNGEKFCPVCGEAAPADSAPIIENTPAESTQGSAAPEPQNVYGGGYYQNNGAAASQGAGAPNAYQQPQQQQGYNYPNAYGAQQFAPYGQGIAVKKKSKKPLIAVICVLGAAAIITLIVLLCVNITHKSTLAGQLEGKWSTTYSGETVTIEFKSDGTVDMSGLMGSYSSYSQLFDSLVTLKYDVDEEMNLNLYIDMSAISSGYSTYSFGWSENAKTSYAEKKWYLSDNSLYIAGNEFTRVG